MCPKKCLITLQNCSTLSKCQRSKSSKTVLCTVLTPPRPFPSAVKKGQDPQQQMTEMQVQSNITYVTYIRKRGHLQYVLLKGNYLSCFAARQQLKKQMKKRFLGKLDNLKL